VVRGGGLFTEDFDKLNRLRRKLSRDINLRSQKITSEMTLTPKLDTNC
jgi:hypothetical protein